MTKASGSKVGNKSSKTKSAFHKKITVSGEVMKNQKFIHQEGKDAKYKKKLKIANKFKVKNKKPDETTDMSAKGEMNISKKVVQKRKSDDFRDSPATKKSKVHNMKFKERKVMWKKKGQGEKYDIVKKLKMLWEELRRHDSTPARKKELLNQICCSLKGRVKEFALAHDTVRILECVIAEGTEGHRSHLFNELKDDILTLSKLKYAKYFLLKMLKYGNKEQKETIMNKFQGLVTQLIKHTDAAEVIEMAYNECANARQRYLMVQEFYGSTYRHFKESDIHSLADLLAKKPETKQYVIKSMKEELLKVLEKSVIKHSLVHHVLLQFFLNCDPVSRSEVIQSLKDKVPEILHTKDGSRVAMHCIWHGNSSDRKVIIKHMKSFVKKIAMEEYGHMVLLALFDCVDDTVLIEKVIIKELQEALLEISQNVHGKKVLVYLLNPRDPHFFHPDIINILKIGDNNPNSKKDPEIRCQQLKAAIAKPLTDLIVSNIAELYKNNAFCLLAVTILKHTVGNKREAFEAISEIVAEPYTSENKNVHIIEHSGSFFMLKQLILNDDRKLDDSVTFSEVLVNTVPDGVMKTWFHCNRGAFLLVSLLETKIPTVINRIKEEMTGLKRQLAKLNSKGVEILLKKLKEL